MRKIVKGSCAFLFFLFFIRKYVNVGKVFLLFSMYDRILYVQAHTLFRNCGAQPCGCRFYTFFFFAFSTPAAFAWYASGTRVGFAFCAYTCEVHTKKHSIQCRKIHATLFLCELRDSRCSWLSLRVFVYSQRPFFLISNPPVGRKCRSLYVYGGVRKKKKANKTPLVKYLVYNAREEKGKKKAFQTNST